MISMYTSSPSVFVIVLLAFSRSADFIYVLGAFSGADEIPEEAFNNSHTKCGLRPMNALRLRSSPIEDLDTLPKDDDDWDKVIGGSNAFYGDIPWQAGVRVEVKTDGLVKYSHFCGAAIINEFWLLSAAHCFNNKVLRSISVIVGDHHLFHLDTEQFFKLDRIIRHELYRPQKQREYDIALIKISPTADGRGIMFNNYVQPICLPGYDERPVEGAQLIASGWGIHSISGKTTSEILQQTTLPLTSQEDCKRMVGEFYRDYMICAGFLNGNTDLCKGDSGGAAAYRSEGIYILYGIISFGTGCSLPNYPVVLTSIHPFLKWIESSINRYSNNMLQRAIPSRPATDD